MFDWLDVYSIKARLFPALLAIAPALAFGLAHVGGSFQSLGLPEIIITVAVGVLFFFMADYSRRAGLKIERRIFSGSGGKPFPTVLRHRDETIDARSKLRYHAFLAGRLDASAPSPTSEVAAPGEADAFYIECGNWLRENTRDHTKFNVLFNENIAYGARRNALGLKPIGLFLNLIVVIVSTYLFYQSGWEAVAQNGVVLLVAAIHAWIFLFWITEENVRTASTTYGRQLVLSCEALMNVRP